MKMKCENYNKAFISHIRNIDNRYKLIVIASFVWGVLAHGMGLFNKYSMHDDIDNLFDVGGTYLLGRWFLQWMKNIQNFISMSGSFSTPLTSGFFCFLCISISSCLIVDLLNIYNYALIVALSGVMIAFPTVTGMFFYMFTAPYYMIGLLLAVGGTYILCKWHNLYSFLIGCLLITFSVGTYQAFIPVSLGLMLFYLINKTDHENSDRTTRKGERWEINVLYLLTATIFFILAYFGITKIVLYVNKIQLSDYQGISSMGEINGSVLLKRIKRAYLEFFNPLKSYSVFNSRTHTIYRFIVCMSSGLCLYKLFANRKSITKLIHLAILFSLVPLAVDFIFVMMDADNVYDLTEYGQVMTFVFSSWIVERNDFKRLKLQYAACLLNFVCILMCAFLYCRYDNVCYLKADFQQQRAISYFTTLITQIKSTEGYKDDYPVAFISEGDINDLNFKDLPEFYYVKTPPLWGGYSLINDYSWLKFMNYWCAYCPELADPENFEKIPEVQAMPSYPDDGSIKVINDTVIVKF